MSEPKTITFSWPCPKGHEPEFNYEPEELKSELDNGTLKYKCIICGEFYLPNEQEKRQIRERMEEALQNG
jgi:hypothetical protein